MPRHPETQPSVPKGTACRSVSFAAHKAQKMTRAQTGSGQRDQSGCKRPFSSRRDRLRFVSRVEDGTRGPRATKDAHTDPLAGLQEAQHAVGAGRAGRAGHPWWLGGLALAKAASATQLAVAESAAAPMTRRRSVQAPCSRMPSARALRLRPAPRLRGRDRGVLRFVDAPLQSRLLTQAGQKKYKGRHSFADFLPSTVE